MLSRTVAQICYDGNYFGICLDPPSRNSAPQLDIRYGWLVIARLMVGYPRTGLFLFEQTIELLEDRLFYSNDEAKVIAVPEYVELISIYLNIT